MDNLFFKWKTKIPKYISTHENLFEILAKKGGKEGEKKTALGKVFSSFYELYIYAFFLGLYSNRCDQFANNDKFLNFSMPIQDWGKKSTSAIRKDFTHLQEFIFIACVAKSEIDLISLDKGLVSEEEVVKILQRTLEYYVNGGLNLIQEKLIGNDSFYFRNTTFLDLIKECKFQ